jgi:glyoxylase-like metal-dependent hydrolase (beta-lactamase superfamily II)
MIFKQFLYHATGCAAYLAGCSGQGKAVVIDPQLHEVETYLSFAAEKGMAITHVIDTHVHADHVSGGRELAERAGATYALHESADVAFPFHGLKDGEEVVAGNVVLRTLHTPGHTPESISLLVTDRSRGDEPWFLLTGDTLFVGTVGRPDLPGRAEESAAELYESLHQKLLSLPDRLEIYPGHFSGSVCGAGMSGKPMSTLAFEKRFNDLLSIGDREDFVEALTRGLPAKPADMLAILRQNQGRTPVEA